MRVESRRCCRCRNFHHLLLLLLLLISWASGTIIKLVNTSGRCWDGEGSTEHPTSRPLSYKRSRVENVSVDFFFSLIWELQGFSVSMRPYINLGPRVSPSDIQLRLRVYSPINFQWDSKINWENWENILANLCKLSSWDYLNLFVIAALVIKRWLLSLN